MSFTRYPGYEDSGVEWLGEIPDQWRVLKARHIGEFTGSGIDKKEVNDQESVRMFNYTDVYNAPSAALKYDDNLMKTTTTATKIRDHSVQKGDILITPSSETANDIGVAATVGEVPDGIVYSYHLQRFRPKCGMDGRFLTYAFNSVTVRSYFARACAGTTRMVLSRDDFNSAPIAVPPACEQPAIASFLDREAAKIDALVEAQRRLIALLKEKRQADISHAITKGLDPTVPMKESGVEWLGKVPQHWEVKRFKHIGVFNAGAGFPHEDQGSEGEELPFHKVNALAQADASGYLLRSENTVSRSTAARLRAFVFPPGAIVFAKIGAALLLGRIRRLREPSCLDNNMMGFVVGPTNCADFALHVMSLVRFDLIANPGTVPSLNEGQIANLAVAVPPQDEQVAIAANLAQATAQLDGLTRQAQATVSLLLERRTALISAAVTGKIDVRGLATIEAAAV